MSEYIKREDAIESAGDLAFRLSGISEDYDAMEEALNAIPAANVRENVYARWETVDEDGYVAKCSNCGYSLYVCEIDDLKFKYCPTCGAEFRCDDNI